MKKKGRYARRRSPVIPVMLGIVFVLLVLLGSLIFYIFGQLGEAHEAAAETAVTTWETTLPETEAPTTEATTQTTTEPATEPSEETTAATEETTAATEEKKSSSSGSGSAGGGSSGTTPPGGIHNVICDKDKHMWVDLPQGLYNQKADCTREERATQVCGNCLELRWVVTAPPLGHDWILIEDCPATVGGYGYKKWECTRCNIVDTRDVVDPLPPETAGTTPPEPVETDPPQPVETEPAPEKSPTE